MWGIVIIRHSLLSFLHLQIIITTEILNTFKFFCPLYHHVCILSFLRIFLHTYVFPARFFQFVIFTNHHCCPLYLHKNTHTHTHIYIYIYNLVIACVHLFLIVLLITYISNVLSLKNEISRYIVSKLTLKYLTELYAEK